MEGSGTDLGGRMHGQRNVLEDIEEASGEFVYNGAFSSMDEASDNLGLSLEESQALQELAKNCQAMIQASDEKDSTENLMCSFGGSIGGEDSLDLSLSDLHFSDEEDNNQQSDRTMDSLDFSKNSISADEPPTPVDAKPPLTKRNTCGTMYVGTTMSAPDKDATIRCVCGVFRAHILSSETEEGPTYDPITDQFRLFNDRESQRSATPAITEDDEEEELNLDELIVGHDEKNVPDLDEITFFYRDVFTKAQMESDCIIMSLVYVERLIKMTSGLLRPRRSNWRSLLFSCMILSSKVWDDLSMWNADFSHTCPAGVHFTLKRINELELAILKALRYRVKVPASEYAKYYFLLRSMLIKSGLGEGTMGLSPLDVEGAKKLQTVSWGYQTNGLARAENRARKKESLRSKSMGSADRAKLTAALEQVVNF